MASTSAANTAIVPRAAERKWPWKQEELRNASNNIPKINNPTSSQPASPATKYPRK